MRKLAPPPFFSRVTHKRTTLFTSSKKLQPTEQRELESQMLVSFSKESYKRSHSIITLESSLPDKRSLFCKTQTLRHRNSKLRSTMHALGLNTRAPAIAEIKNNLITLQKRYTPDLIGYGLERNQFGIINKVLIITDLLEESITLQDFIKRNPDKTNQAIIAAFNIIGKSISEGMLHLDCWIGNILTNSTLSQLHLIDLEYCKFNSKSSTTDQLIFSLGYLYGYQLNKYISNEEYFLIMEHWLTENFKDLDNNKITEGARAASLNIASRKQRMIEF